ncbi:MAG: hypothetical protein DRP01_01250 [Archaeoglobales archaeon]|nr:MAG: hypothetical protein DRP01_01250 [Archaeoglobales archaeon]
MVDIFGAGAPLTSGSLEIAKISGETVIAKVSGETVITRISGETVIGKISGETVIGKISGETVLAKVSGETVVAKISGQTVKTAVPTSLNHGRVIISGTNLSGASPVVLGSAEIRTVLVKAEPTNSGTVYIGDTNVSSDKATHSQQASQSL